MENTTTEGWRAGDYRPPERLKEVPKVIRRGFFWVENSPYKNDFVVFGTREAFLLTLATSKEILTNNVKK
jgi:hypothetical protein